MKRLVPIVVILSLGLWFGCSSDDGGNSNGNGGDNLVRVIADTSVDAPSLDSVDDPAWDSIAAKILEVSGQNSPKIGGDQSSGATAVSLKAILKTDTLFLRVSWTDPTYSVWRDIFRADSFIPVGLDTIAHFKRVPGSEEDQLFVMFDVPDSTDWDVWNWRVLTTAPGGLAEGFTLRREGLSWRDSAIIGIDSNNTWDTTWLIDAGVIDTLVPDAGNLAVASPIPLNSSQPSKMHTNGPAFNGYLLWLDNLINIDARAGWQDGDTLPGWYIDSSFNKDSRQPSIRNSRFDIKAASSYGSGIYTVVLSRALSSFADDLDMSGLSQVKVKIGLYDNQSRFMTGSGNRGFTAEFWLVLQ